MKGRAGELIVSVSLRPRLPDVTLCEILQTYSKAIDEYRRDAIRKLEQLRKAYTQQSGVDSNSNSYSIRHCDRISGFILLLRADLIEFFRFDYYSFLLQWTSR